MCQLLVAEPGGSVQVIGQPNKIHGLGADWGDRLQSESRSPKCPLMSSGVSDELGAYHSHTCSWSD